MRTNHRDAFVELTDTEEKQFFADTEFRARVIRRATELADETGRTVIVAGPDDELGTVNDVRGWRDS